MMYHLTTPLASSLLKAFHLKVTDVDLVEIALNLLGAITGALSAK